MARILKEQAPNGRRRFPGYSLPAVVVASMMFRNRVSTQA